MKLRWILALATIVIGCSSSTEPQEAPLDPHYHDALIPIAVGNWWKYDNYGSDQWLNWSAIQSLLIDSVLSIDDSIYEVNRSTLKFQARYMPNFLQFGVFLPDGQILGEVRAPFADDTILIGSYPSGVFIYSGIKVVIVPAGTFQASTFIFQPTSPEEYIDSAFIARGVGLVLATRTETGAQTGRLELRNYYIRN